MTKARIEGLFELRELKTAKVFIAMSEKEVAAVAFPTIEGRFDYLGFTSREERARGWCLDVFQFYWDWAVTPDFMQE